MANHPGAYSNPQSANQDMYVALDIGPVGAPPPVNHPGAYVYPVEQSRWEREPEMDMGARLPVFPVGHPRGNLSAPYNANCRGLNKRDDKKVKPL